MVGLQSGKTRSGVMVVQCDLVAFGPSFHRLRHNAVDPTIELRSPEGAIFGLQVPDHRRAIVRSPMVARLETLDSARAAETADQIFALVAVRARRRGEALAFHGQ